MSFTSFNFHSHITAAINASGYTSPTPIQLQAIPPALEGRDLLGLAQTGTGKTAAFVLPILQRLLDGPRKKVRALIIAPTRELAEQTHDYIGKMSGKTGLRSVVVYGGVGKQGQIKKIRTGIEIIVACPGRLLDHLGDRTINLNTVELLVLDEADHMFDKGFLPDIRRILKYLPKQRQTLIFSATMPKEIRRLTKEILNNPETVQINHTLPAATISHRLFPVEQQRKTALLKSIMEQTEMTSTLVFTRTKHRAKKLAKQLQNAGYSATSLQGNLSQQKRQQALDGFKHGKFKILVATDVASRGIDVSGISHVINYDMPDTAETYTHRTGRTGRAARTGEAFTFAVRDDSRMLRIIERSLGKKMARQTLPGFNDETSSEKGEKTARRILNTERAKTAAPSGTSRRKRRTAPFDFDARNLSRRSSTRSKRMSSMSST